MDARGTNPHTGSSSGSGYQPTDPLSHPHAPTANAINTPATHLPSASAVNLRALIESKSHELSVLGSFATAAMGEENAALQHSLTQSTQRYARLKADFEYNLTLLAQRDAELARYDELSVTYARTLEQKQEEWREQARQAEAKLDEKIMQLADMTESHNKLRQTCASLQEQLSTSTWHHDSEVRALRHNASQSLKDFETKLSAKEELLSKNQYELMHTFERASEEAAAEAQAKIERLKGEMKLIEQKSEQLTKDLERSNDRIVIEQHKRTTLEQQLEDTNTKLLACESREQHLKHELEEVKKLNLEQVNELNGSHESLLKKCVYDYKTLSSQLDKVQSDYLRQQESHRDELEQLRREHERWNHESEKLHLKQLKEKEHELNLIQQQLRDATTLASTVQSELDEYVRAEQSRTVTLNDDLTKFQTQHATQVKDLNLAIWKSQEELRASQEKVELLQKSLDARRDDLIRLKDELSTSESKCDELERKSTEIRLKSEREVTQLEETIANMKLQLRTAQDGQKRAQAERDQANTNHQHAQGLITEYQQQLKQARDELLTLHSAENHQLEHRLASEYPHIQHQLQEVGRDLESLGANMNGFDPFAGTKTTTGITNNMTSYAHMQQPLPQHIPSATNSGQSYAAQLSQQHFRSDGPLSPRSSGATPDPYQGPPRARPRPPSASSSAGGAYPMDSAHTGSLSRPSSAASHHQHNLSRISEQSDPTSSEESTKSSGSVDALEHQRHQRQLSNSDPTPVPLPSVTPASLSSSAPNPGSQPQASPTVKIVTALQLNVESHDDHQPITIETAIPSKRSFKSARKTSITSPNINLNAAQASLESLVVPQMIPEERRAQFHDDSQDSGSENDFVEHPLTDSSLDDSRFHRPGSQQHVMPQSHQQAAHGQFQQPRGIPRSIHQEEELHEESLSAELVHEEVDTNPQRRGNVTPPEHARAGETFQHQQQQPYRQPQQQQPHQQYRPTSVESDFSPNGRPIHSPRPYTPAFSEDMGPVSLPNSMPNSPTNYGRPNSGTNRQIQQQQQQQHQQRQQQVFSPTNDNSSLPPRRPNQHHQQHIPTLPLPQQPYDSMPNNNTFHSHRVAGGGGGVGGGNGSDSHRSSQSTTSHTSSHVALEHTSRELTRDNATLRQQNESLSQIIREMKSELENLLLTQQKQQDAQAKLDAHAATNLPPGTVAGTVSVPATQYKALQLQLQSQSQTLASQTKQLEEQRSVYQKLQFHHALLLAELESVQQHLPPSILQQHIAAELTFLRTYTRELNATITNLKTELMYLQAQHQHSSVVLDSKNQQTILLHSQTQQLEQLQVALQFKEHKLIELDAQLQSKTREVVELKTTLSEAQHRLATLTIQAQQDNTTLKQHNEMLKQQAVQQMLAQQQQQQAAAQAAVQAAAHQQTAQAQVAAQATQQPNQPPHIYPIGATQPHQQPYSQHPHHFPPPQGAFYGPPYPSGYPAPPPVEYGGGGYVSGGSVTNYPGSNGSSSVGRSGYDDDAGAVYPHHARRSSAPHVHSPPESSRDSSALTDLSSPPRPLRLRSRSASTSPSRTRSRSRSRGRKQDAAYSASSGADDSLDLSLSSGRTVHGRRDLPFHASDRATASQLASSRSIKLRAELIRKKDLEVKARADVARAKVREQMRRMKEIEIERKREEQQQTETMMGRKEETTTTTTTSKSHRNDDEENNPWSANGARSIRITSDVGGKSSRDSGARSSTRATTIAISTTTQRERSRSRSRERERRTK